MVVDEASQATEPAVLVALTRGSAFTVLAGDPRQLPPTVLSEEAARQGLGVTLFERVAGSGAGAEVVGGWIAIVNADGNRHALRASGGQRCAGRERWARDKDLCAVDSLQCWV